jgi:hypothetical protein
MRSLSDADLLHLWEGGLRRHPLDRALLALGAAFPETPYEHLADWPLGRRNRALVELRCNCFGPKLQGWTACPSCAEKLEFELDGRVIVDAGPSDRAGSSDGLDQPIVVKRSSFRLPTSRDLASVVQETDPRLAAIRLVENCRLATVNDEETSADDARFAVDPSDQHLGTWSDEDLEEIGEQMALADPLAETRLTLHCPKCEVDWEESLDMTSFLWTEIDVRVRRLLLEIHILATAYGWTEAEILSLGENRRVRYVEMVQS